MEVFSVSGLESSLGCEFRTVICDSQLPLPNHTAHAMSDILRNPEMSERDAGREGLGTPKGLTGPKC